jgi:hypothetical protein
VHQGPVEPAGWSEVWLLALHDSRRWPGGSLLIPELTRAGVSVRQLADAAGVEMGETAPAGTGDSEVDTDVVQVQAPPDIDCVIHSDTFSAHDNYRTVSGLLLFSRTESLQTIGNIGDVRTDLLAENRQHRNQGCENTRPAHRRRRRTKPRLTSGSAGFPVSGGPGREVSRNGVEVAATPGSVARDSTRAISWSPNSRFLAPGGPTLRRHPKAGVAGETDRAPVSVPTQ